MSPTLTSNQIVIVKEKTPFCHFDIVLIKYLNKNMVKRLVGLPGDTVKINDDQILVNDQLNYHLPRCITQHYLWEVPDHHVAVIGDNPNNSLDSRKIGFLPWEYLLGRVILRIWPPKYFSRGSSL